MPTCVCEGQKWVEVWRSSTPPRNQRLQYFYDPRLDFVYDRFGSEVALSPPLILKNDPRQLPAIQRYANSAKADIRRFT